MSSEWPEDLQFIMQFKKKSISIVKCYFYLYTRTKHPGGEKKKRWYIFHEVFENHEIINIELI